MDPSCWWVGPPSDDETDPVAAAAASQSSLCNAFISAGVLFHRQRSPNVEDPPTFSAAVVQTRARTKMSSRQRNVSENEYTGFLSKTRSEFYSASRFGRQCTDGPPGGGKSDDQIEPLGSPFARRQVTCPPALGATFSSGDAYEEALPVPPARLLDAMDARVAAAIREGAVQGVIGPPVSDLHFCFTVIDPGQPDYPVVALSRGFEWMTGYATREVLGKSCRFLQGQGSPEQAMGLRVASETGAPFTSVLVSQRKSGELFLHLVDLRGLIVAKHEGTDEIRWLLICVQADVTRLSTGEAKLMSLDERLKQLHVAAKLIRQRLAGPLADIGALLVFPGGRQGWHAPEDGASWRPRSIDPASAPSTLDTLPDFTEAPLDVQSEDSLPDLQSEDGMPLRILRVAPAAPAAPEDPVARVPPPRAATPAAEQSPLWLPLVVVSAVLAGLAVARLAEAPRK